MSQFSVSIVVTVLNEEATIEALLDALRLQTLKPQAVIVTDGGSTDNTVSVLKKYQEQYPKFPLTLIATLGNRSVGRNLAIRKVRTQLIAITDAGCIPERDWLKELILHYIKTKSIFSKLQVVVAGFYSAQPMSDFEAAVVPYVLVQPDKVNPQTFLPATRSMLMETKTAADEKFDESLSDNEDYEFARRIRDNHHIKISFCSEAVVLWRPRSNLKSFAWMIFRFARGDAQAWLWRPKVALIFIRYLLALIICWWLRNSPFLMLVFICVGTLIYSGWSIQKNQRYAGGGWYWLPLLQITSDFAVMCGTLSGLWYRFQK